MSAHADTKPKGDKLNNKKKLFIPGIKHVKFEGASSDLMGHVFDIMQSKTKQIDQYNSTLDHLKTYIGVHMDPMVLEAIEELSTPTLTEPLPLIQMDGTVTTINMKKWEKRYNRYLTREEQIENELKKIYAMIWGQCSDAMQTRIQESATYETTRQAKDAIGIVRIIKTISFNYRAHQEPVVAIDAVKHEFFKLCQGKHQSVQEFYGTFKNVVKVNEELGAEIGRDKGISDIIAQENSNTTPTEAEKTQYSNEGKEQYLAIRMLMALDRNRFGGLIEDLHNDYLTG